MTVRIPIDRGLVAEFCRRYHISKLGNFGSALRDDFHVGSDVDVLVEFEAGHVPGLLRLAGMELELGELLGRKVEMRTPDDLSRYFRELVVGGAETVYVSR
jgi:predicted nucleotidyltransferase